MPSNVYKSKSMFGAVCKKAGLILKNGEENNEISVDKAVFQKNVTLALKHQQGDISEVIEEFLEGFGNYIEDLQRFHKSLLPTMTTKDCDSARSSVQDSVVRILLGVESLQPCLIKNLLEKLPEFSQDDDDGGEGANIPRLLLAQFRWLDFVVDSKGLTKMLLELVEATELDVQREIISALPSIVDDSNHAEVASKLKELLVCQTQLTVVILDALVCLDLAPEVLNEVRGAATRALQSVDAENLPVVLKFLLKTATAAELPEVVGEIRNGLDLYSVVRSTKVLAKGAKKKAADESQDCVLLIVDTVQSGIQFQRGIADAWLKTIEGVKEKLSVLDLVVLLVFHQTKHRKAVESLVRNKIRSGAITETLLHVMFTNHSQVVQGKFKAVLSLAEILLKSSEVSLSYIGSVLYKLAFRSLDSFCRQEIVANLVMHLGSGNVDESDASLDVLAGLVEQHLAAMAPFAIFFKRLLDFQQQSLPLLGMRKLFGMLARLGFSSTRDPALIQDDLHMVIRKLVSSMDPKSLCRGVVGGVMMVWGMGRDSEEGGEMSESRYKEVESLLTMIRSGSSRHSEAAALFLDELAAMVSHGNLHNKVETWILENMTDMFQENFVVDIEEENTSVAGIPMSAQYCLNDKEESIIVINLLPLVAKEIMESKASASQAFNSRNTVYAVCLSPHFRLVQMGERRTQDGSMEGIDALLGCPLYLPEETVYTKLDSLSDKEKDILCTALFHCLNWFREIVNAFASQSDVEMKGKVIERLHDITHLMQVLAKCLAAHPKYSPSLLGLGGEDSKQPSTSGAQKGKAAGEKKRGKKRKLAEKENETAGGQADSTQDVTLQSQKDTQGEGDVEADKKNCPEAGDLSAYAHCFRELDLEVFTILHSGPITHASLDTELHTKRAHEVQIETLQLQFLMEDLVKKLNHSLIASASKRRSFPNKTKGNGKQQFCNLDQQKPQQVARFTIDLLPALCTHLEAASAFFQTLMADNDGMVDGPGCNSPEAVRMATCLHLLLQAFTALFSWNGFGLAENRQLLKESLSILVGRVKVTGPTQQSMPELMRGAFQYMEKFAETVPSLPAATSLVRLLAVLANRAEDDTLQQKLGYLSQMLLQREWLDGKGQREKGAVCNEMLQTLIKTWVTCSADPTVPMQMIADTGMTQLLQAGKQAASDTFPTLTRSSFPVFLRVVMSELVSNVKRMPPLKRSDGRQVQEERLLGWSVGVRILFLAVGMVKEFNSRAGIAACLKYGRQFVDVFLLRGMPVLDATFTSHSVDVHSLLRSLQQSTRTLQNMCSHAKRMQDVSQINQVPVLKRALERLVLRVKHMLSVNNCQRAFWMGNLKNKTLKGEEILSQATSQASDATTATTNNEEEETMPDDDDDSEVEMDTTEKDTTGNGASSESGDGSVSDNY